MVIPRTYQTEAIVPAVDFLKSDADYNSMLILPTGSGKSVVIANIAKEMDEPTLVLQPSKEILEQNYAKFISYGFHGEIYSASLGSKYIGDVTFATIGSIYKKPHLFRKFKNIIIDECHEVNPDDGMYRSFLKANKQAKVLGLTATPYRLQAGSEGAQLSFINRMTPRLFKEVLYYIQNDVLFNAGHLAPLEYFDVTTIDRTMLEMNSSGSDFTTSSLKAHNKAIGLTGKIIEYANRVLAKRNNLLVFCSLVSEAFEVAKGIPGAVVITGETDLAVRAKALRQFKSGAIRCVVNCDVLSTGFDYPGLEAALNTSPTMSLAVYYQRIGRVMRPYEYPDGSNKTGWFIDMGGNIPFFGKIETMKINKNSKGLFSIWNNGKQLTDVAFSKN